MGWCHLPRGPRGPQDRGSGCQALDQHLEVTPHPVEGVITAAWLLLLLLLLLCGRPMPGSRPLGLLVSGCLALVDGCMLYFPAQCFANMSVDLHESPLPAPGQRWLQGDSAVRSSRGGEGKAGGPTTREPRAQHETSCGGRGAGHGRPAGQADPHRSPGSRLGRDLSLTSALTGWRGPGHWMGAGNPRA